MSLKFKGSLLPSSMSKTPEGGKRLVIKPLRARRLPQNFEEETWIKVEQAVLAIQQKKPVSSTFEELYQAVCDLCDHNFSGQLYERLHTACDRHLSSSLQALIGQSPDPSVFLGLLRNCWQDHCDQMLLIRSICLYLDRTHAMQTRGLPSLWDMGLNLFKHHFQSLPELEHKALDGILKMVEQERQGNSIDRGLVKHVLSCFISLDLYAPCFSQPFLDATREFYSAEGERFMQMAEVAEYLQHCESRLLEESERCSNYLDASTRQPLVTLVEAELIKKHVPAILDKGFSSLVEASRWPDLARMHSLLARVEGLPALRACLAQYILRVGVALVQDEGKPGGGMVEALLELKARMDVLVRQGCGAQEVFVECVKESFHQLVNSRENRPAELIARFMDARLRAGSKGGSEEEMEAQLESVLVLFRFIQGKDIFEAFYKKDLAKRLLMGKSASADAERLVISKLKTECGSQFTNKLEGMFKDIDISREINESFHQHLQAREDSADMPAPLEMNVQVLTTGFWPTYPMKELRLPAQLSVYQELFRAFYLRQHSGRRLQWLNPLGSCVVKAAFPRGTKELQLSLFQAVTLLLFNDTTAARPSLSLQDLQEGTGLEDKELRRTLQSLACGKVRVLTKVPKSKEVEDKDCFEFNADFTNPLVRIKVNAIQMKETVEENYQTTNRVFKDRQYQIDAAIVRIMKTRKVLSHSLLIAEIFQQLQFPIQASDLKKRIESLIDREYLERDQSNPQIYNYLA